MQLFNVNGDSAYALDISVHYPMLQMIVFFDWIKPEDVANGTACPRSGHSQSHTSLVRVSTWKWAEAEATGHGKRQPNPVTLLLNSHPRGHAVAAAQYAQDVSRAILANAGIAGVLQRTAMRGAAGGLEGPLGAAGRGGRVRALQHAGQRRVRRAALLAPGRVRLARVALLPRSQPGLSRRALYRGY